MKKIEDLRKEIDNLDHELLNTLVKRMTIVKQIGELKDSYGLPVVDEKRRAELLQIISEKAKSFNLSADFIKKIFTEIHDHAVDLQKKV